jgi:hypothetical protein
MHARLAIPLPTCPASLRNAHDRRKYRFFSDLSHEVQF